MNRLQELPSQSLVSDTSGQFLILVLNEQEFGIDVLQVHEIMGLSKITPVPGAGPNILGLINLRGAIIPVVDLRRRFEFEPRAHDRENAIVIVSFGKKIVGLCVDSVADVVMVPEEDFSPTPELIAGDENAYILGMGKLEENRFFLLLDVEKLLAEELHALDLESSGPELLQRSLGS